MASRCMIGGSFAAMADRPPPRRPIDPDRTTATPPGRGTVKPFPKGTRLRRVQERDANEQLSIPPPKKPDSMSSDSLSRAA